MTFEGPALAAGFASTFDEIGPYIGFGSLVAVVAMAILVFAQGRELQRLREWAGTSPERLDQLEQEVRDGAASRQAATAPRPGAPTAVPGAAAGAPGAPPRPPGTPGAAPPGPPGSAGQGSPVVGAGSATPPGVAGGPPRPTPPRPTPPGAPGAPARAGAVAASSTAGGPRAATAAGAAATARDRDRDQKPERSIGQIIGVSVVAVVVLLALLFAFNVIGGGGDGPGDNLADPSPTVTTRGGSATTSTPPRYPRTEMTTVVLNASGRNGLAGDVSDEIDQRLRLAMSKATNYTGSPLPTFTSVQWLGDSATSSDNRQNRAAASDVLKLLKKTVPGARMLQMTDAVKANSNGRRLVVIVGPDYAAATPQEPGTSQGTTGGTGSTGGTAGSTGTTSTGQLGTPSDGLGTGGTATP